jgi:murein DD-endopeptidase MepM/ murein hydrolase activator NlpD
VVDDRRVGVMLPMKHMLKYILPAAILIGLVGGYFLLRHPANQGRTAQVVEWIRDPSAHPDWRIQAGERCGSAPFILPTDGFAGFLWADSFYSGHTHQGVDIFGGTEPGKVRVVAAADGYLTRLADWKSTVIVRIPNDPLQAGRQIWTYYTHLADAQGNGLIDAAFPPGTTEKPIKAGTLLGYQGNFSGTPGKPVGVHLHFSIVRDDGQGHFLNELEIGNTLDPSPYLGLPLNAATNGGVTPVCR